MILTMKPPSLPWQPSQQPIVKDVQYTDFSKVPDPGSTFPVNTHGSSTDEAGRSKSSFEQFFPTKLHAMLSELEKDGLSDICGWSPHGRAFHVHKQDKFVNEIIPKWFRQTGYASFRRQLNLYGFRRITSGRDKGAYHHQLFLRGKRFLADRMERVKLMGPVPKGRKRNSPETEPNFYLMEPLPLENHEGVNRPPFSVTPSVPSASSVASSTETGASLLSQVNPLTALELLQQGTLQNLLTTTSLQNRGLNAGMGLGLGAALPAAGSLAPSSQLNDIQLAQLLRPALEQQQQQQQRQDLEAQILLQDQIQQLRARLLAQILSRNT